MLDHNYNNNADRQTPSAVDANEQLLLELYRQLDPQGQADMLRFIEALARMHSS